jgi:hypothetical protein
VNGIAQDMEITGITKLILADIPHLANGKIKNERQTN